MTFSKKRSSCSDSKENDNDNSDSEPTPSHTTLPSRRSRSPSASDDGDAKNSTNDSGIGMAGSNEFAAVSALLSNNKRSRSSSGGSSSNNSPSSLATEKLKPEERNAEKSESSSENSQVQAEAAARNAPRLEVAFEQEKVQSLLSSLPSSITDRFGHIGFAERRKQVLPALVMNPFNVLVGHGHARETWMEHYQSTVENNKSLENLSFLVYWYGENDIHSLFSLVPPSNFTPWDQATQKMKDFAMNAKRKRDQYRPLNDDDEQKLRAMKALTEDLGKSPLQRLRNIKEFLAGNLFGQKEKSSEDEEHQEENEHPDRFRCNSLSKSNSKNNSEPTNSSGSHASKIKSSVDGKEKLISLADRANKSGKARDETPTAERKNDPSKRFRLPSRHGRARNGKKKSTPNHDVTGGVMSLEDLYNNRGGVDDDNRYDDDGNSGEKDVAAGSFSKDRLRRELEQLHEEMEVAEYARTKAGQRRRRVPRDQSAGRSRKRKALERKDLTDFAHFGQDENQPRMRGGMAALEGEVLEASLVFQSKPNEKQGDDEEEVEDIIDNEDDGDDEDENEGIFDMDQEEEGEEDDDGMEDIEEDVTVMPTEEEEIGEDAGAFSKRRKYRRSGARSQRKRLYRLRNFKSYEMAQRHGEALGALVQGRPKLAVFKLKQLAKDAPSAPQVYSSLGMVYEDVLRESQRKRRAHGQQQPEDKSSENGDRPTQDPRDAATVSHDLVPEAFVTEEVDIAKKAYGAYHVAAVLCRRDFSLWVRAADMALEIADLYRALMDKLEKDGIGTSASDHQHTESDSGSSATDVVEARVRLFLIDERRRWLSEAKNDYQTADNLKPPGIDVPCKLASIQMELGLLSEALTLMTDLKNSPSTKNGRSDFASSYKAWLLFAELMLRAGHECEEWNNGKQYNDTYMTRRWLRKWSTMFDWRERRLQALARALEAAAGTKCCRALLEWLQARAVATPTDEDGEMRNNDAETAGTEKTGPNKTDADEELWDQKFKKELEHFDKTTFDLGLETNPVAARERENARRELIDKLERERVVEEVVHETIDGQNETAAVNCAESSDSGLPPRASVRTVCAIAADLMRLLLEANLCDACRLVGEAVSTYLKDRAIRMQRRQRARQQLAGHKQADLLTVLRRPSDKHPGYWDDEKLSSSESEAFSDDDDFDQAEVDDEVKVIRESFRQGLLPPNLLFMYGIALGGLGGKDFLARKYIESLTLLEQEKSTWLSKRLDDKEATAETRWTAFQMEQSGQFRRMQAFAFAAKSLESLGRQDRFLELFVRLSVEQEEFVVRSGFVQELCKQPNFSCPVQEVKAAIVVSTVVASVRYKTRNISTNEKVASDPAVATLLLKSVQTLSQLMPGFWKLNTDKTLSPSRMSVLSTVADAVHQLVQATSKKTLDPCDVVACIAGWLPTFCCYYPMNLLSAPETGEDTSFDVLPFPAKWQSTDQYRVTLKCYNLAVGRNMSYFSGWQELEFNGSQAQLRRRQGPAFYGISTAGGQVAGYLSPHIVSELINQWELLYPRVTPSATIVSKLSVLCLNQWYSELEERVVNFEQDNNEIAMHGEDEALSIMLSFSRMSITTMTNLSGDYEKAELALMNALSVLLPLTQFCLNEQIWECGIGSEAASRSPEEWQRLVSKSKNDGVLRPSLRPGYVKLSRRIAESSKSAPSMDWFRGEDVDNPLNNIVYISNSTLAKLWKNIAIKPLSVGTDAVESMQTLHKCMLRLRKSFTEVAVERASLEVAAALLQVANFPECENGFVVFQHAAMFAGQGAKEGTNDLAFKAPLPEKEDCCPHQALVILGRAGCLQAIHFYQEAAFLCGFIASVCAMRRLSNGDAPDEQWKIVSIAAYNTSVHVRYAGLDVLRSEEKKLFEFEWWDSSTKEELSRGRRDGLKLSEKDQVLHRVNRVNEPPVATAWKSSHRQPSQRPCMRAVSDAAVAAAGGIQIDAHDSSRKEQPFMQVPSDPKEKGSGPSFPVFHMEITQHTFSKAAGFLAEDQTKTLDDLNQGSFEDSARAKFVDDATDSVAQELKKQAVSFAEV